MILRQCPHCLEGSVIDVGCGDLSFWTGRSLPSGYIGIDFSETVIARNRSRPDNPIDVRFIHSPAEIRYTVSAEIVFCLDLLFHVIDNQQHVDIIRNLCRYSSDYIFVFTWITNPFRDPWLLARMLVRLEIPELVSVLANSEDKYQKYRAPNTYLPIFDQEGFDITSVELPCSINPYAAMLIFRRRAR